MRLIWTRAGRRPCGALWRSADRGVGLGQEGEHGAVMRPGEMEIVLEGRLIRGDGMRYRMASQVDPLAVVGAVAVQGGRVVMGSEEKGEPEEEHRAPADRLARLHESSYDTGIPTSQVTPV